MPTFSIEYASSGGSVGLFRQVCGLKQVFVVSARLVLLFLMVVVTPSWVQAQDAELDCFGTPLRQESELALAVAGHAKELGMEIASYGFHRPELECKSGEFIWSIAAWPKSGMPPGNHWFLIRDEDLSLFEHIRGE